MRVSRKVDSYVGPSGEKDGGNWSPWVGLGEHLVSLAAAWGEFCLVKSTTTAPAAPTVIQGAVPFPSWVSKAAVGSFSIASFTATWGGIHVGGLQMADIFLVSTFVLAAMMVVFGNLRFPIPRWLWAPAVALLTCFTALMYSPVPAASVALRYEHTVSSAGVPITTPNAAIKSTFWIVALLIVPIAAIACTALESRMPKWIMAWFLAGVAISSFVALTDLTNLTHISRSLGFQFDSQRQTGLSDHPNTLGLVCAIAAPFAVYFISESRRRWLPSIALVLLCGGVLVSGSRGAQVAFPVAGLIAVLVSPHKKKLVGWLTATIGGAILGGLTALTQLAPGMLDKLFRFEPGATLPGESSSVSSDAERSELAIQAWSDFKSHPLFGLGVRHINEAHNIYLQMMSAGGSILVVGMLVYWFGTFRSCWLVMRSGEAKGSYLMASIVVWLVLGTLENQLTDRFLYYTVGCVAALAANRKFDTLANGAKQSVGPAQFPVLG